SERPANQPLRFPVQDIYRFDERRILAGRVEAGSIKVGDKLLFSPGNKTSTVKTIERWNAPARPDAAAGESIGITLTEQIFVERGAVAALETASPYELSRFKARLFWLGHKPFSKGKLYKLKLATQQVDCEIETIEKIIDASTLETISRAPQEIFVGRHEVAELTIRTKRPVAFDTHSEIVPMGRFVIVDEFEVSGGGIVAEDNYPKRTADSLHKSDNIFWSKSKITSSQRSMRNRHAGCVVWLTGLSGAGKSTIATELERELFNAGKSAYVLDGDKIRHGLCSDLAFSPEDRKENIRRVGEVAKLFADAGIICVTAFISPYRADRELVRKMVKGDQFIEVFVNAPLAVCEQRDPKGLYVKARANQIKEFTGISAPYEVPPNPELELHTDKLSTAECVARIMEFLHAEQEDTEISI
ncbi:MAG TPA: adenylyl-sulfate kinase, partial [Verrucomicrobiae bacterium]|nr:adenylyl-sulfate kinase [Verrucomicrobiae bacterium]